MDGQVRKIEAAHSRHDTGIEVTKVPLRLAPVTAVFFVEEQ